MMSYNQLTPRQQTVRQNAFRTVFYAVFACVSLWRVSELQEEANADAGKIEDAIIGYQALAEEKDWADTLFMSDYMRDSLTLEQYRLWCEMGK
ncbi:hypothetical protein ACXYMU_05855 [Pontibacter sp. CAU 1760]